MEELKNEFLTIQVAEKGAGPATLPSCSPSSADSGRTPTASTALNSR